MSWIKVSDQVPPYDKRFLYYDGNLIIIASFEHYANRHHLMGNQLRYCHDLECAQRGHSYLECTHSLNMNSDHYWMPLPEIPQAVVDGLETTADK